MMKSAGRLTIDRSFFRDVWGRSVLLRGLNLGGDCKVPVSPDGHTYLRSDFSDHRTISFIGRPFPLTEADSHFRRIAGWGFNCLRLLVTWEAVQHAGPGQYDEEFLDYFASVCRKAGEYGLHVFVDFHQDVWSRMSGGDGAPGWTWEAAGLDFTRFDAAGAAHVMQYRYDHHLGGRQEGYPVMSWPSNYRMPANGIIWSLFFAGADVAPGAMVSGKNIQHFLQDQFFGSMRAVAERLGQMDHVIGFDTLNEPGTGYVGKGLDEPLSRLPGPCWTPLSGLAVASGLPQHIAVMGAGDTAGPDILVNEQGQSIWLPGKCDPFREAGVWDIDEHGQPVACKPDHFAARNGRPVDLERDYMAPFFRRVAETVRSMREDWLIFAEINPFAALTGGQFPEGCPERTVNASHWYDLSALVTKSFTPERMIHVLTGEVREGAGAIQASYEDELGRLKAAGDRLNGGSPTLIGECGIQYDLNGAEAYHRWAEGERGPDIWSAQESALDLMYNALDAHLLSSTQWNYTASNRNDPMVGDGWNQEDLSVWSIDQFDQTDPQSGGRAVAGFSRPYVRAAQGSLLSQRFDRQTGLFEARIDCDPDCPATEIVLPPVHYPAGVSMLVDGQPVQPTAKERLLIHHSANRGTLTISVRPKPVDDSVHDAQPAKASPAR
jgi:hypothetical protein